MIPIIALLPLFPWFLMIQKNLRLQYRDEGIRGSTLLKKAVHLFHSMHVTCAMRTGILRRSSSCLLPDALSSSAARNCFQPVAIPLWWLWADYSIRSTHLLNSFYRIWNLADFVKLCFPHGILFPCWHSRHWTCQPLRREYSSLPQKKLPWSDR